MFVLVSAVAAQTHSGIKINNYLLLYLVSILEKNGEKSIVMERERLGGFLRVKCLYACVSVRESAREGKKENGKSWGRKTDKDRKDRGTE